MEKRIEVLKEVFALWNRSKFNNSLPQPVMTIQSNGRRKSTIGWCSSWRVWAGKGVESKYEINLCAEFASIPFNEVAEIMLHEMCHLSNTIKGIDDCGASGYHNKKFKKEAERVGLKCFNTGSNGWAGTGLTEELIEEIGDWKIDKTLFNIMRGDESSPAAAKGYKYECPVCGAKLNGSKEFKVQCVGCKVDFVTTKKGKKPSVEIDGIEIGIGNVIVTTIDDDD